MKNQKIIKILSILVICLSLITIFSIVYSKYKDKEIKKESVVNKIKNVKQPLIYFTSSSKNCETCESMDTLMKFYKEQYNLKYYTYNIDREKLTVDEFLKTYDFKEEDLVLPMLGLIKNNMVYSFIQNFSNEPALYQFLMDNELISENKNEEIVGIEEEDKIVNESEEQIFYVGNKDEKYYKERKKILKSLEGTEYKIKILISGLIYFEDELEENVEECTTNSCETPPIDNYLLKVKNGKVIDKLNDFSKEKVLEFMKS